MSATNVGRRWLACVLSLGLLVGLCVAVPPAHADEVTVSDDTLRTGWDPNEPNLAPSDVEASDFGQLFSTRLNGEIYAQPIVADGVLVAATENNYIYGLNPVNGTVLWTDNAGPFWPASAIGCGDLVPNVGITSTPVYDPTTQYVYFTSKVDDGVDEYHPDWYMNAVNITTGAERPGFPTLIHGSPTNDPSDSFNAFTAMQRPGLLLLDGVVYAGFASHCDSEPYVGYIVGVGASSGLQTTMWSTEGSASNSEAGIWQSGGGLVSDGPGQIIVTTGNGVSPPQGPGDAPPADLAESVIRLQVQSNGSLKATDFFSPVNNTNLDQDDADLGAGGPVALPSQYFGVGTADPDLLVQIGKDGRVFLLNRDNLGGQGQGPGDTDNAVQILGPYQGVWGHPAVWPGDGGYVYSIENQGPMQAFEYGVSGSNVPSLTPVGTSAGSWGYTSGSPVVTSDGTTSGSALVWGVYSSGSTGSGGELRAYLPVPVNGVLQEIFSAPIGNAAKFAVPATDNGRVYVGTRDGNLIGFGVPASSALQSPATEFTPIPVDTPGTAIVTVTATTAVTVKGASTSNPFGLGDTTGLFPAALSAGDSLRIPVTFSPTTPGQASGELSLTSSAGTFAFGLEGDATQAGLYASPPSINFGAVPTGATARESVIFSNSGTTTETITDVSAPGEPFATPNLQALTSTPLAPGASVTVAVTYSPTTVGPATDSITIVTDDGSGPLSRTVGLQGTAVTGAPRLTITPGSLNFGDVAVGSSSTKSFVISNTGNLLLTLNKAAPPSGVFTSSNPVSEGQQITPVETITQDVTFAPKALGDYSGVYVITGNDGHGAHNIALTGTGVPPPPAPLPAKDGHWAVASDGGVFTFGDAKFYGSMGGRHLNAAIVGMAATPDGRGYWLVGSDGGIFAFGDARFYGSMGGQRLNRPIVGIAATRSGHGYYLVAKDGGIFTFGDAKFRGSTGNMHLNAPIVGMTVSSNGGYTLVATDGGIFNFGTSFYGSEGGHHLNRPVVGMVAAADGRGYTEVAADGGDFTFGPQAPYFGSVPGLGIAVADIVGGASLADGGYVDVGSNGFAYWFSSTGLDGTETLGVLNKPLVAAAGMPG